MPYPDDRLQELRRQRALVHEHLAWLDREIASTAGEIAPAPTEPNPPATPAAVGEDIDALMESYRAESQATTMSVRRGCFFVCGAVLLIFGLCVLVFYLYVRSHQTG